MENNIEKNNMSDDCMLANVDMDIKIKETSNDFSIKVPLNPTNGDVIKAMFPHMDFAEDPEETGDVFGRVIYMVNDNYSICFDSDWWNAPYKEGDIKS